MRLSHFNRFKRGTICTSQAKKQFEPKTQESENTVNIIETYTNWRRYRTTVNELSRLNARELADLGISRSSIRQVARQSL